MKASRSQRDTLPLSLRHVLVTISGITQYATYQQLQGVEPPCDKVLKQTQNPHLPSFQSAFQNYSRGQYLPRYIYGTRPQKNITSR